MSDTRDIEKKSLEAHVELCAERYKMLELKLETVEEKITGMEHLIRDVASMVTGMAEKRNNQLVGWGVSIIGGLIAVIAWLASQYFKTL
jgi:hypothetical protein